MRRRGSHAVSAGRVEPQPEPPPPPGPRSAGRGLTLRNYCVLAAAWASTFDPLYLWNDCSARFTVVASAPPPQPVVTVTSVSPTGASVIELMNEPHGLAMGGGWMEGRLSAVRLSAHRDSERGQTATEMAEPARRRPGRFRGLGKLQLAPVGRRIGTRHEGGIHTCLRATDQMKPSYQKCSRDTTRVRAQRLSRSESSSSAHTP